MDESTEFCTVTMARVYIKQGCLEKAADIYRRLLAREPDREDLAEGLADVERKLEAENKDRDEELARLFRRWIELSIGVGGLNKLMRLR